MSAIPPNCSLYEILQTPCGSSREEVEHVLLSECNENIPAHLASCHLSKCSEVTEAKLIGNLSNGRFRGDGDLDRKLNHDPCITAHDLANFPAVAGTSTT